jgi:hypothetical protein
MNRLVVNGCSYMSWYAKGQGHTDLARQLNISDSTSLALQGSCNTRILRTCIKDSYTTVVPTFYLVGLSFLGRGELPIRAEADDFEGKWISINNHPHPNQQYDAGWNVDLIQQLIDLRLRSQAFSVLDRLEELMYQLLATVDSLVSRGHQILIFRQADDVYEDLLDNSGVALLKKSVNIIDGLKWGANAWQFDQGVKWHAIENDVPRGIRHPPAGQYQYLNTFLVDYIRNNKLI